MRYAIAAVVVGVLALPLAPGDGLSKPAASATGAERAILGADSAAADVSCKRVGPKRWRCTYTTGGCARTTQRASVTHRRGKYRVRVDGASASTARVSSPCLPETGSNTGA